MTRRLLQLLAVLLLTAAFVAVLYDGTRMIAASGATALLSGADIWNWLAPGGADALAARLRGWPAGWLWEGALAGLLRLPAAATCVALAAALGWGAGRVSRTDRGSRAYNR